MLSGITISNLIFSVSQTARCHSWMLHLAPAITIYFVEMLLQMSHGILHSWGAKDSARFFLWYNSWSQRRNNRGAINGFKAVFITWKTTVTLRFWMSPRNCKLNIKSSKEQNVVTGPWQDGFKQWHKQIVINWYSPKCEGQSCSTGN